MTQAQAWSGPKDAGWHIRFPAYGRVKQALQQHKGQANRVTMQQLAIEARVPGRPLRAILAESDGRDFLVAYHRGSVYLAVNADEGDGWTRHMKRQIRTQQERVERRERFAEGLWRTQKGLL